MGSLIKTESSGQSRGGGLADRNDQKNAHESSQVITENQTATRFSITWKPKLIASYDGSLQLSEQYDPSISKL
jgi:hypothetical protein